jgi:hypothetical protein
LIRLIGDIHGDIDFYLANRSDRSIQVGDYGIGFIDDDVVPKYDPNHRWIRGNHDNPYKAKQRPDCIIDGTVEDDWMYIGGAWSIDWAWRTPGRNWWYEEELSTEELNVLIAVYQTAKPTYVVTHDGPLTVTESMFIKAGLALGGVNAKSIPTRTGQALQAMFEIHQPKYWFFGHWHITKAQTINGTTFVCLGENDFIDIDPTDPDQIHNAINEKCFMNKTKN